MFDISFGEILLIVVVAVLFIGPKDLPVVIRTIARGIAHIKHFIHEVKDTFSDIAKESGIKDFEEEIDREMNFIRGDDGKLYPAYDISDFVRPDEPPKITAPDKEASDD